MCMHGPLIKIYFGMMNGYHKISFSSEILTTFMWVCRLNWMEMGMDWIGSTIYMSSGWVVLKLLHLRMSLPAVLLCSDEVYPTLVRWLCLWISFDLKPNKRKRSKENQSMYEFDFDLCFYFFILMIYVWTTAFRLEVSLFDCVALCGGEASIFIVINTFE